MSADNWAHCPRCRRDGELALEAREAEIMRSYGLVPVEEFDRARADLVAQRKSFEETYETFREDYEIFGAESGRITVSYSGECTKCGLGLKFQTEHQIPGLLAG